MGEEIDRLEKAGILEKVDWAAPIVPIPKKDGKFRICGDYKVTINPALEIDQHPLPRPEEIFDSACMLVGRCERYDNCLVTSGHCWPNAADEEWHSPKRASSTVTVNSNELNTKVSALFLSALL